MNNTPFGVNAYYVQRTFSEDSEDDKKGKDSFWKKHKKKILAAAALAAAGGLGAATWNTKPVKKARAKVAQAIAPEITLDDIMDSPEAQKAVETAQKAGDAIREKGEAAKNKIQEWGKSLGFSDHGASEVQRQFADADKKASFWQKHKRKILAGAALAGAGALGYKFRNEIRYGLYSPEDAKKDMEAVEKAWRSGNVDEAIDAVDRFFNAIKGAFYTFRKDPNSDASRGEKQAQIIASKGGIILGLKMVKSMAEVDNKTTPEQKKRFCDKIDKIIEWLDGLGK